MAYWDKGSKDSRNHGLPASLTDEFIKLDGEVNTETHSRASDVKTVAHRHCLYPSENLRPRMAPFAAQFAVFV